MPRQNRRPFALVPGCQQLDVRLAPSGNFLAHGFSEVADAVKHVGHRPAEHGGTTTGTPMTGTHGHHHGHHVR